MFIRLLLSLYFAYTLLIATSSTIVHERHQTLMISFDGVRSSKFEEFIENNPDCAFNTIIKNGVKAEYLIPSFPSLTFPNHYTLVTGIFYIFLIDRNNN